MNYDVKDCDKIDSAFRSQVKVISKRKGRGIRAMVINVFWCLIDKLIKTGKDEGERGVFERRVAAGGSARRDDLLKSLYMAYIKSSATDR